MTDYYKIGDKYVNKNNIIDANKYKNSVGNICFQFVTSHTNFNIHKKITRCIDTDLKGMKEEYRKLDEIYEKFKLE